MKAAIRPRPSDIHTPDDILFMRICAQHARFHAAKEAEEKLAKIKQETPIKRSKYV